MNILTFNSLAPSKDGILSWLAYKFGGEFLEAPSKEHLASALTSLATFVYIEDEVSVSYEWRNLPWPMLACLNSCHSGRELLELADKATRGELGDVDDWIAAETRWFEKGIVRDDLLSMSDDRLPFDPRIGETGFPTTLSPMSAMIASQDCGGTLVDVLELFDELPPGKSRSFVAKAVNWLIFAHSISRHSDDVATLPQISLQTLESVYREVPSGSLVPLHVVISLISQSINEAAEFFSIIKDKTFFFDYHNTYPHLTKESVKALRGAYMELNQDAGMLQILGVVAENGQLAGQSVDIKDPKALKRPDEKLAALLVTLCQETWRTDSSERLITTAQEVGDSSSNVFGRIVTTLENNRPVGDYLDKFLVALERLIPADDYRAHERYINLLHEVLGRRTSRFADLKEAQRFALPEGIVELLTK